MGWVDGKVLRSFGFMEVVRSFLMSLLSLV